MGGNEFHGHASKFPVCLASLNCACTHFTVSAMQYYCLAYLSPFLSLVLFLYSM